MHIGIYCWKKERIMQKKYVYKAICPEPIVNKWADVIVIYVFLLALGFPGNYEQLFGSTVATIIEYSAFIAELGVMFFVTASYVYDIKLFDMKTAFIPLYVTLVVFFVDSLLVTVSLSEQFISCFRFSVTACFGMWLVLHYELKDILKLLYKAQWIFVILTIIFIVLFPGFGFNYQNNNELSMTGLFTVKNACALELMYGLMCQITLLFVDDKKEKIIDFKFIVLFVIQIILMLMCRATGAIFCFLIPVVYVVIWKRVHNMKPRLPIGILFTVISVVFIFAALPILSLMTPFLEYIGKDPTLTGRTVMWEQIIDMMMKDHTLTGYGFSMFWRNEEAVSVLHSMFKKNSWYSTMMFGSHNMVLELWLDVGLIGLGAYFFMILWSFRNVSRMQIPHYVCCVLYMGSFMLKGLTERAYTTNNFASLFLFVILAIGCLYNDNQIRKKVESDVGT